ncbi:MAG: TonB-dependent receptor [Porticoccaceae bacterium]
MSLKSDKNRSAFSTGLKTGIAAIAVPGMLSFSAASLAQLEEIIVTAQKRAEDMQSVPIAITAMTSEMAGKMGIINSQTLAVAVPGLRIDRQSNGAMPFLRGVGTPTVQMGAEPAVAAYVDGIYYNNGQALVSNYNSLERIEVLKGPQGTLFGRNATGGVIQIYTKDPTPEPALDLSVGYANYDTYSASLYGSGALSETVSANLALYWEDQKDGWGKNYTTGNDAYTNDNTGGRVKVLWQPSEQTSVLFNADYDENFTQQGAHFRPAKGTMSNAGPSSIPPDDEYDSTENIDPAAETEMWGGSVKVTHDFSTMRLVSITGYRETETRQYIAQDAAPIARLNFDIVYEMETFTQEFQIHSPDDSPVQWMAGVYWYDDTSTQSRFQFSGLLAGGGLNRKGAPTQLETESFSVFGQMTIPVTEAMDVTFGLRRTTDDRTMSAGRQNVDGNGVPTILVPASNSPLSDSWSSWSGKIAVDYQFSDTLMAYVAYNRGFKSGTINTVLAPDFLNLIPSSGGTIDPPVEPEKLDAYTLGFKSELFDRKVRINAEAFWYDYTNLQLFQVMSIPGGGTASRLTNAAEVEIKGIDIDITAAPTDRLTLNASLQLQDGEYKDYPNGQFMVYNATAGGNCAFTVNNGNNCAAVPPGYDPATGSWNLAGNETIYTPSYSLSLTGSYVIPTDIGEFDLSLSWSHTDEYFFDADNGMGQVAPSTPSNNMQDKLDIINGAIAWYSQDEKYSLRLWGRNLTDERYISMANETGTMIKNVYGPPRTYGLTFMARMF